MRCHTPAIKTFPTARALLVAALGLTLVTGCSLLNDGPKWGKKDAKAEPVVPSVPEPVPTHRFEIDATTDIVGVVQKTQATKEDTLTDIARRFNVGYEEIVRANPGVDPWLPGEGKEIVIPSQFILPNAPREGIVINAAAMRLFYYPKMKKGEKQVVHTYPIGIGKVGWKTPEGATKIVRRQAGPTWRPTPSIIKEHLEERGEKLDKVIGPGPDNPLGKFAFYLGWPSYMIHGTNKPAGVGLRSSHGCIRLYPEDIAVLFEMVPIGTQVRVVNQPYVFGWSDGQLYMQPYDVLEDDTHTSKKTPQKLVPKALAPTLQKQLKAHNEEMNWTLVSAFAKAPRGVPVPVSVADSNIDQVIAAAPLVLNQVPEGSTWDGRTDLPMDEGTFRQMLSEIDPSAPNQG